MTDEHRLEQLSRAYMHAVAAAAGCTCARPEPDYGIDLTLRRIVWRGSEWVPGSRDLDVQLKSTTTAALTPNEVVYDLDVRAYDILRRSTRSAPVLLLLVLFPAEPADRLIQSEDRLEIRGSGYWLWLRGMPAVTNTSTARVHIPRQNQFTPTVLERIMEAVHRNEDPV